MYHDVVPRGAEHASGFPGRDAARYKLTPECFAAHIDALARVVAPSERERLTGAAGDIAVTFDDGGISALRAADLLEIQGLRGWFFVTTDYVGRRGFLCPRDLRALHERGHILGSHSCSHPLRMAHCSDSQLRDEWCLSRRALSDVLGTDVDAASVPGGDYSRRVAVAAGAAGYTTLFTSEPTRAVTMEGPVTVVGRFVVRRGTTAATVAAVAAGAQGPMGRQALAWNARKLAKRVAGSSYLELRRLLLRHGAELS